MTVVTFWHFLPKFHVAASSNTRNIAWNVRIPLEFSQRFVLYKINIHISISLFAYLFDSAHIGQFFFPCLVFLFLLLLRSSVRNSIQYFVANSPRVRSYKHWFEKSMVNIRRLSWMVRMRKLCIFTLISLISPPKKAHIKMLFLCACVCYVFYSHKSCKSISPFLFHYG